jgi:hypothetical protein
MSDYKLIYCTQLTDVILVACLIKYFRQIIRQRTQDDQHIGAIPSVDRRAEHAVYADTIVRIIHRKMIRRHFFTLDVFSLLI